MSEAVQSATPAYRALADELRKAIGEGRYPAGAQLPTELELAATYDVSRQTVRRAFSDLVSQSLVYRVRGRGTFAIPTSNPDSYLRSFGSIDELLALSEDSCLETTTPFALRADVDAAGRLRLDSDQVLSGEFRRIHSGGAFCITAVYLPPDLLSVAKREPALFKPGAHTRDTIIGLIDKYTDRRVFGAHQSISAATAPEHAEIIGCKPGAAVLRVDRLYYDREGAFVELAVSYFNPDMYTYRVNLRRASTNP